MSSNEETLCSVARIESDASHALPAGSVMNIDIQGFRRRVAALESGIAGLRLSHVRLQGKLDTAVAALNAKLDLAVASLNARVDVLRAERR